MKVLKIRGTSTLLAGLILLLAHQLYARQNSQIWITEIQVEKPAGTTKTFFVPEVHLYETGTDRFLGCAGLVNCTLTLNNGVVSSGYWFETFYSVQTQFQKPDSSVLFFNEIANTSIYLRVFDNTDTLRCPGEATIPPDVLLATSPSFAASELGPTKVMQFGQIAHLRMGNTTQRTPPTNSPIIEVKEIEVTGESDGIGKLEIEVHLYEQGTDRFLACSGQINGLRGVDVSGQFYIVDADFRRPFLGPEVTFEDIKDTAVYFLVIEDDAFACPCPNDNPLFDRDDFIARTGAFPGAEIRNSIIFKNLGKLKHLGVNLDGVPFRVALTSPQNLALINTPNIAFTWQPGNPNPVDIYNFQLAADSSMANVLIDTTLKATQFSFFAPGLLQNQFYWWRVRGQNAIGWGFFSNPNNFVYLGPTTDVEESPITLPTAFSLQQNYPNPFNPSTVIRFQLPVVSQVRLHIYNLKGQLVRTLVNEQKPAGRHQVVWDGRNDVGARVPSGVYLYRIEAGDFHATRRLALVK
jgi:hypothetical protein